MEKTETTTCQVCGGTEYTNEGGHYYCNECHTQTQEIFEVHYDLRERFGEAQIKRERQVKPPSSTSTKRQLTSWEYYNYILIGLTDELIELGAPEDLKLITLQLWANYLQKHQVAFTSKTHAELPQLSYPINKRDLQVVYGGKKRKRSSAKSSTTSKTSDSNITMSSSMLEHNIRRKALGGSRRQLAKDGYEKSKSETSEASQTDTASSKSDSIKGQPYKLNKHAKIALRKRIGKYHLKRHQKDLNLEMTCHKLTKKGYCNKKILKLQHISVTTIYSILYLALLLVHADMQLGDIIRFMWEGHVSFRYYLHFFPDEIMLDKNDIPKMEQCVRFSHFNLRFYTGQLAKYLQVKRIPAPSIEDLCERFITEMNLPNELLDFVKHLIAISPPKMKYTPKINVRIPAYETRALSYIVFAMKFMLGLDGITEHKMSKFSEKLTNIKTNQSDSFAANSRPVEYFNWDKWVEFIECRKRFLAKFYFPIHFKLYGNSTLTGSNLFLKYRARKQAHINYNEQSQKVSLNDEIKKFYLRVDEPESDDLQNYFTFPASLRPFHSYLNQIISVNDKEISLLIPNILTKSFQDSNVQFLLQPHYYATKLMREGTLITFTNGLANKINLTPPLQSSIVNYTKYKNSVTVNVVKGNKDLVGERNSRKEKNDEKEKTNENFKKVNQSGSSKKKLKKKFYVPHYEYWMCMVTNKSHLPIKHYKQMEKDFSQSFKWLMNELAFHFELAPRDIFCELIMLEIQFAYVLRPWLDQLADNKCDPKVEKIKKFAIGKLKTAW